MKTTSMPSQFSELDLSKEMLRAIDDIGYREPTEIQARAIPHLLAGSDLVGRSCTGSGKTAAFGVPAIEALDETTKHAQVLVLAPTRELAIQIAGEMKKFSRYKQGISTAVVYGGAPMSDQIRQLRNANIVIGTPGRLMDHMRRKTLKLTNIQTVVLDEADEMLNMGFIEDIETILTQTPATRQTVLFSATMPPALLKISKEFLTNPKTVDVMSGSGKQADIEQVFFQVAHGSKKEVLSLLMHANRQRSVVFCNTKAMVDQLAEGLCAQGFKAAALHGDMTQAARNKVMQEFRSGLTQSLIATDVAARGIDVDDIDVVINYDLPQSFEYYVHRIGRTGRAGRHGLSQTLISNKKQYTTLKMLMKHTGFSIRERKLPSSNEVMEKTVNRMSGEIQGKVQNQKGKAAQKLLAALLESETFEGSQTRIALALAEELIGGDEQFDRLKNLNVSKSRPSSRKRTSQAPAKSAKREVKRPSKYQEKSKPRSKSEKSVQKKKQRSR